MVMLFVGSVSARNGADTLLLQGDDWRAWIHADNGTLLGYERQINGEILRVPFRSDRFAGPRFESVELHSGDDPLSFCCEQDGIRYEMRYLRNPDHPVIECRITNERATP